MKNLFKKIVGNGGKSSTASANDGANSSVDIRKNGKPTSGKNHKKRPQELDVQLDGKKKKSTLPPPTENRSGINLDIKKDDSRKERRKAFRVSLPGLKVRVLRLKKILKVKDISATGVGLHFTGPRIKGGTLLTLDFGIGEKMLAKGIKTKVVRHDKGVVGLIFIELERQHEDKISKIVLAGQKRQANLKQDKKLPDEISSIKIT